ncbi:MBL fold metallo-hydrolase, partial [Streptococcus pneumoniae]|uniref:MBL fold metallo-hydrolase n=1 Tax=Streptococcus pneumoniae TaxID=1313 RepID=UPI000B20C2A5
MKIHKTVNPVAYENTYYLEGEKHLIVVDPGSHWEAIRQTIEKINKPICAILLTHAHYDHIMSLDLVRETFGNPPVYIAESEASWLYTPVDNLSGLPRHDDMADVVTKPAEHTFVFHEEYQLEEFRFNPNHSYLSQLDVTYKTPDLMSHFLPPHEVSFTFCCSSI